MPPRWDPASPFSTARLLLNWMWEPPKAERVKGQTENQNLPLSPDQTAQYDRSSFESRWSLRYEAGHSFPAVGLPLVSPRPVPPLASGSSAEELRQDFTLVNQTTDDLVALIASAEAERAAWNEGRRAYQDQGVTAVNPHSPRSPNHVLWADGFEHERSEAMAREKRRY